MKLHNKIKNIFLFILLSGCCSLQATEKVLLDINFSSGLGDKQYTLSQLLQLPQHEVTTNLPWTEEQHTYSGPYLDDVLKSAQATGQWLCFEALDKYKVTLNYDRIKAFKPILALKRDGQLLTIRTKGPIWLILPVDDHETLNAALYNDFMVWHLVKIGVQEKEPK